MKETTIRADCANAQSYFSITVLYGEKRANFDYAGPAGRLFDLFEILVSFSVTQ